MSLTDPPGPPVSPKVTDTSNSTISLSWTKPANDGGSEILGYLVECKRTDATDWIRCNVPKNLQDTHYVVTGLLEKSEYQLRVSAVNKAGFGQPCEVPDKHVAKDVFGMNLRLYFLFFNYKRYLYNYYYIKQNIHRIYLAHIIT